MCFVSHWSAPFPGSDSHPEAILVKVTGRGLLRLPGVRHRKGQDGRRASALIMAGPGRPSCTPEASVDAPAPADQGRAGNAEPEIVVAVVGFVPVAVRRTEVPRIVVPGAAAVDAVARGDRPGSRLGHRGHRGRTDRRRDRTARRETWRGASARYARARHARSTRARAAPPRPATACRHGHDRAARAPTSMFRSCHPAIFSLHRSPAR